jgi:hypothetical protein
MKSLNFRTAGLVFALATVSIVSPLLAPGASARQGGSTARVRREFRLAPPAGQPLTTTGKARIESRERSRQSVKVEVESRALAAGTQVAAYAFKGSTEFFLGTLTLRANPARPGQVRGELELKNWDETNLPTGLAPVTGITRFEVREPGASGVVLLTSAASRPR